ncbi:hypothetical protein ASJ79_00100 [Mycobacterium sp. NAZ190054]|nr:hypothetical protein ASJ79_00100 [Mycobacterium sp. NAZ190054]
MSVVATTSTVGLLSPVVAHADPVPTCDDPSCVPGINRIVDLGSYCDNVIYHVFATTPAGRVVFCDSAKGLAPRYFRALPVAGIREFNTPCDQPYSQMAQAPDGLFLLCAAVLQPGTDNEESGGQSRWVRGDHWADN